MLFQKRLNIDEYSKVFFATDWHDLHDKDFVWGARGFSNVQEHSQSLKSWIDKNLVEGSILIYQGDLCLNAPENYVDNFFNNVKSKVFFIMGNHDQRVERWLKNKLESGEIEYENHVTPVWKNKVWFFGSFQAFLFDSAKNRVKNKLCINSHFPLQEWDKMNHGSWHVHGHVHGSLQKSHNYDFRCKIVDASFDVQGDWGIDFEKLKEIMDSKQITHFHHGKNNSSDL